MNIQVVFLVKPKRPEPFKQGFKQERWVEQVSPLDFEAHGGGSLVEANCNRMFRVQCNVVLKDQFFSLSGSGP